MVIALMPMWFSGGVLKSNKGVNLPGATLTTPIFTDKDQTDLKFGLEKEVDMVAISFVQSSDDIVIVREAIENLAKNDRKQRKHQLLPNWKDLKH
jgi:pyruvate kinase